MLTRIVDLFERMVVALEKLAVTMTPTACSSVNLPGNVGVSSDTIALAESAAKKMGNLGVQVEEKAALAGAPNQPGTGNDDGTVADTAALRETIKNGLIARGVSFKASARTETLQKMLDVAIENEAKKSAPVPESSPTAGMTPVPEAAPTPVADDPFATESAPPVAVTREQARDYLVALSAQKGKDAALTLLKSVGKAEKMTDVDPANYAAIVAACKQQGVEVA